MILEAEVVPCIMAPCASHRPVSTARHDRVWEAYGRVHTADSAPTFVDEWWDLAPAASSQDTGLPSGDLRRPGLLEEWWCRHSWPYWMFPQEGGGPASRQPT